MDRPRFVVFTSYRGGVGRTLAACNVAARMAQDGDRVLVLDLDLEAPGASVLLGEGKGQQQQGLVELFARFVTDQTLSPLEEYIANVNPAGIPLRLLPAGRIDADYPEKVGSLDLVGAFQGAGETAGGRFFRALREGIGSLDPVPHYVLIDARPGLSTAGAAAVEYLADEVVVIFGMNRQSLVGLQWFHRHLRENVRKPFHWVASLFPPDQELQEELSQAREVLGAPVRVRLPFDSDLIWRERLLVSTEDRKRTLAREYDVLSRILRPPDDVFRLVQAALEKLGTPGEATTVSADLERAYEEDPRDIRVVRALVHYHSLAKEYDVSLKYAGEALAISPEDPDLWRLIDGIYENVKANDELRPKAEQFYANRSRVTSAGVLSWLSTELQRRTQPLEAGIGATVSDTAATDEPLLDVLRELKTRIAEVGEIGWGEVADRLPRHAGSFEARLAWRRWAVLARSAGLDELADVADLRLGGLCKEVAGVVRRFGYRGFGFLATDDGEEGVFFGREECTGFGKMGDDFIPSGTTAVFDLRVNERDSRHPWRAVNVSFPELP